jgi:hypothetical protein
MLDLEKNCIDIHGVLHISNDTNEIDEYTKIRLDPYEILWLTPLKETVDKHKYSHNVHQVVVDKEDNLESVLTITNYMEVASITDLKERLRSNPDLQVVEKRNVSTKRVDTWCKENSVDHKYNFVRIDCGGNELSALMSIGNLSHLDYIYVTIPPEHTCEYTLSDMDVYLLNSSIWFVRSDPTKNASGYSDVMYTQEGRGF